MSLSGSVWKESGYAKKFENQKRKEKIVAVSPEASLSQYPHKLSY